MLHGGYPMKAVIIVMLLMLAGGLHAAGLYKWVDKDGRVQYSDTPPPSGSGAKNVEQRRMQGNVIQSNEAPYALQQTMKNFPVTLWANDCGEYCNKARALLNERGIPFTEKNPQIA